MTDILAAFGFSVWVVAQLSAMILYDTLCRQEMEPPPRRNIAWEPRGHRLPKESAAG